MHHKFYKQKSSTNLLIGGFGLIELMVTISILVLVMSIILTKHSSFNGAVLLRGQTFDVALAAREIQLTAVSVISDSTNYRNVYGIYFSENSSTYGIFKDTDGDYLFDDGVEEYGKQGILDSRYRISDIRLINPVSSPTELSITFERPNFDAKFSAPAAVAEIDICLRGTACTTGNLGEVRTVEITKTGQISVKN